MTSSGPTCCGVGLDEWNAHSYSRKWDGIPQRRRIGPFPYWSFSRDSLSYCLNPGDIRVSTGSVMWHRAAPRCSVASWQKQRVPSWRPLFLSYGKQLLGATFFLKSSFGWWKLPAWQTDAQVTGAERRSERGQGRNALLLGQSHMRALTLPNPVPV